MAAFGGTTDAAQAREKKDAIEHGIPENIRNDKRDIAGLWNAALEAYKNVVGVELIPPAANVAGLIAFGVDEMNKFAGFRHGGGKVDKLRSLLSANLGLIAEGAKQLAETASSAFAPAAIIGTALTRVLSACVEVSADYDVIEVFFNDMNGFLSRVAILERRMPKDKGYQNCLMDVFISFLRMCGFATAYIKIGRFKKWIKNLLQADNGELGQAREDMKLKVKNLYEAIALETVVGVEELKAMEHELQQTMKAHEQLLVDQTSMLGKLQNGQDDLRADLAKFMKAFESTQKDRLARDPAMATGSAARENKAASASRIRSTLPTVDGEISEYHILKETTVPGTCTWVFSHPEWLAWTAEGGDDAPRLLAITGGPGSGKSHIAAAVRDYLDHRASDPDQRLCLAHFYFREQNPGLDIFRSALITAVNQVAEQNPTLRDRIYAQLVRDDVRLDFHSWRSLLRGLLQPCFEAGARYRLFLLFDGIDELDDDERANLGEFWGAIVADGMRISLALTSRPESAELTFGNNPTSSVHTIHVTKELQRSDIATIVRNQLGNLESLKRFSPYVKQQISEKIEATAPNLLYAHHMLRYFNSIGREGAVLVRLQGSLPESLDALYEVMLAACMRRTVDRHHKVVGVLFCWLAFSFRPLVLDEVVSLLRDASGDASFDLDDIPEPMMHFVRIGDPGRGSGLVQTSDIDHLLTGEVSDPMVKDGRLPVKFRQRAMRTFFCQAGTNSALKATRNPVLISSPSEAHRRIFLAASRMCRLAPEGSASTLDLGLTHYATFYLMYHWMRIQPEQHSDEERVEIMERLASVMSNEHSYSKLAQEVGIDYERDFGDDVLVRMRSWAAGEDGKQLNGLSPFALSWWQRVADQPANALVEIAKGHVRDLYQATSTSEAVGASDCAFAALLRSGHGAETFRTTTGDTFLSYPAIIDWAKQKAAHIRYYDFGGLTALFHDVPITPSAYRAIASVLLAAGYPQPALTTCMGGLACKTDTIERYTLLYLAAQANLNMDRAQDADRSITECLNLPNIADVPESLQGSAHIIRARVYARLRNRKAAAAAFSKARTFNKGTVTGGILDEEVSVYRDANDYVGLVDVLRSWSPIERVAWLTLDRSVSSRFVQNLDFHSGMAKAEQWEYLVEMYDEAITQLDNFAAAASLRVNLAEAHLFVRGNAEAARPLLDKVLGDQSDSHAYKFTDEEPRTVLSWAINLQSQALCELFTQSRNPVIKMGLLEAARGLMKRPLASSVSSSTIGTLYHEIQVARMSLQMGPRVDFQTRLQCVISTCFDTLEDDVAWNDRWSLWLLAQALAHLDTAVRGTSLRRAARILISAYFSVLDPVRLTQKTGTWNTTADTGASRTPSTQPQTQASRPPPMPRAIRRETMTANKWLPTTREVGPQRPSSAALPDDDGDLSGADFFCDGSICQPRAHFRSWRGRPMYACIDSCDRMFCGECQDALRADQAVPFCCRRREHIEVPIEGWRGIRDGIMRIEGEQDVPFKMFLQSVRDELEKAWDEFWAV